MLVIKIYKDEMDDPETPIIYFWVLHFHQKGRKICQSPEYLTESGCKKSAARMAYILTPVCTVDTHIYGDGE